MAQQVKDPALPQRWHRFQLQLRFDPWPGELPYAVSAAIKNTQKKPQPTNQTKKTKKMETKKIYYVLEQNINSPLILGYHACVYGLGDYPPWVGE